MKTKEQIVSEIATALSQRHSSEKEKYCARRRAEGEGNPEMNIDVLWVYNWKDGSGYLISFKHGDRALPVSLSFEFRNATVVANGIAFNRNADLTSAVEALWHHVCEAIWEHYSFREFIIHPSFFKGSEVVTA